MQIIIFLLTDDVSWSRLLGYRLLNQIQQPIA